MQDFGKKNELCLHNLSFCGKRWVFAGYCELQIFDFFHFYLKKFAYIQKKVYLCTLFSLR